MIQCTAPDVEMDWFEMVEREFRENLRDLRGREELIRFVSERFGMMIDVGPTKAVLTDDPAKEMQTLASIYLAPTKGTGRLVIVDTIKDAFRKAGLLELVPRDLDLRNYTGPGDPFQIDFGYRVEGAVKMFHALSLTSNLEPALALLSRYQIVAKGMRQEGLQVSLTAIVDQESALKEEKARFAMDLLIRNAIRVEPLEHASALAEEVRRDAKRERLKWISD
jgi:hypothetical protein